MQIAFSMVSGLPWVSAVMPSKYLISPRQSQPRVRELAMLPMLYSPESKAFFLAWTGAVSP